jgi:hypothetical protein
LKEGKSVVRFDLRAVIFVGVVVEDVDMLVCGETVGMILELFEVEAGGS